MTSQTLLDSPTSYGIGANTLIRFNNDDSNSHHTAYLDLLPSAHRQALLPDAIIEDQGNPILYLVSEETFKAQSGVNAALKNLLTSLACRADARFLAKVHPGYLEIYPINLAGDTGHATQIQLDKDPAQLHHFLTGLGQQSQDKANKDWLDNFLFRLLTRTATRIKQAFDTSTIKLENAQILSLVGRSLFMRFLGDREIIADNNAADISLRVGRLENLFDTPQALADSFAWQDRVFNGNLLQLIKSDTTQPSVPDYLAWLNQLDDEAAKVMQHELGNVMRRTVDGQSELGYHSIQFRHVPADMLSQVYEHFAHAFEAEESKKTSVHYTPRHIAQQLVNSAFSGLELTHKSRAQVIDPSVGAGVFLVLAFKRLVQERWRETEVRPDRDAIRSILNSQLCGLDINPESLKFAALSLYLTALELDPKPHPLSELKFDALDGAVLIDVGQFGLLGSLHQDATSALNARFDIVVGNPPWTETGVKGAKLITPLLKQFARQAILRNECNVSGADVAALTAKGGKPDIAFVWRSLGWAKPNAMLAFALDAQHLLFRQGDEAIANRRALFSVMEVTGILNGSAIRKTEVWPTVDKPFCLLVARNRKPKADSSFYYLNPYAETTLNSHSQYRLDPNDAKVVLQSDAAQKPTLFKTLFRGSGLDLDIVERAKSKVFGFTLGQYWLKNGLASKNGFKTGGPQKCAKHLFGLPVLESPKANRPISNEFKRLLLDTYKLPVLERQTLSAPRALQNYTAPLVIFPQTPKAEQYLSGALLARHSVAYSASFNGYSTSKSSQPLLAEYLQLLSVTDLFNFFMLMSSPKFGVERPSLHKEDIDNLPFFHIENLSETQKNRMETLSKSLLEGLIQTDEINNLFFELFGLTQIDAQVVKDTLAIELPFPKNIAVANAKPEQATLDIFSKELQTIVKPFADVGSVKLSVHTQSTFVKDGWCFVRIAFEVIDEELHRNIPDEWTTQLANSLWASQIRFHSELNGKVLWIGQLAQNRYWTKTRARILAMDILQTELGKHATYESSIHATNSN